MTLRLGTRTSVLALAQAGQVAALVERATGIAVERVGIETEGDRRVDRPLSTGPIAKGWFTAAIEDALRAGTVDFAVHSLKDLPVQDAEGLTLVIPEREDPADVLLIQSAEDPARVVGSIGASSPRRLALVRRWWPEATGAFLRGNVTTRITRLREGQFDGILLAASGLSRLAEGSAWVPTSTAVADARDGGVQLYRIDTRAWPGAPGQGALALQCRSNDARTLGLLGVLEHAATRRAVTLERAALSALGTGCAVPFGACVSREDPSAASYAVEIDGQMVVGECAADDLARTVRDPALALHNPVSGPPGLAELR